jgi:hypothetical protein
VGALRVWRVGAGSATLLARTDANSQVTLAADAKGRVCAVWSDGTFGEPHVLAARSNPEATRFGAPVDAGAVRGAHSTYSVDAGATSSALDSSRCSAPATRRAARPTSSGSAPG